MEPLVVTEEWWVTTAPNWNALVATEYNVRTYGESVKEWRVHPEGYMALYEEMAPKKPTTFSASVGYAGALLGAPVMVDAAVSPDECRALIRRETTKVKFGMEAE